MFVLPIPSVLIFIAVGAVQISAVGAAALLRRREQALRDHMSSLVSLRSASCSPPRFCTSFPRRSISSATGELEIPTRRQDAVLQVLSLAVGIALVAAVAGVPER